MGNTPPLKRTPLFATHVQCSGKIVPFAGWEMPVQYTSILDEHTAVRERVGLFDISHMGEILVAGPNAERALNSLLTNDLRKTAVGQAQYTLLCNERGGVIDDLIVYRLEPTLFLLVINASHIAHDFQWLQTHTSDVVLDNRSDHIAALALQGPAAGNVLPEGRPIANFHIQRHTIAGHDCWIARTGYTGEDGFELICDAGAAVPLWTELLRRGQPFGIKPCGLGARDTLRLEMGYPLHGSDLTEETTPIEAGLGKYVAFDKGDFIGRPVLAQQNETGSRRQLVAFKMTGKTPPPRPHYGIHAGGRKVGEVTSGTQSPTLGTGIGMGYVESTAANSGAAIEIEIRGKTYPATVEQKPLLKRGQ